MVNFADIANDMELNNVLNLGEMTSIEAIDAAVDTYSKDLFSDLPLNIPKPQFIDNSQVKKVSLVTKPVSKPVQLSAPHKADNRESSTNTSSPIIYSENSDALIPAKGTELIGMLLNLRPKFIETDDEFVRILDVSKRVLSGGGKIKRGKPSTGCARRMFSGLFLYAAPEISSLAKAIYSLERMFANSCLYDLLSEEDLQTLYIDDVDIVTEKIYDPHFTNLTVNGIIFSVYYTSNGM